MSAAAMTIRGGAAIAVFVLAIADTTTSTRAAVAHASLPQRVFVHGPSGHAARGEAPATVAARTGHTAFEPTLGVQADGTIFFQGAHALAAGGGTPFGQAPDVLRSTDGGRTWDRTSPTITGREVHAATSDPYLHVDPVTDRVFTVDWVLPSNCSQLSFSDDDGRTWKTTLLGCGGTDHQHLFTGPPKLSATVAYPNVVYLCAQAIPSAVCSKSLDGGLSFAPTGAAPFASISDVLDCGRLTGHGAVDADGTIYLPTACEVPYVAVSEDEGATWDVVEVSEGSSNGNHEAAVAVDASGTAYYFWIGGDRLPYVAASKDGGRTWSRAIDVSPPRVVETSLPALAVSPGGRVAAAYMGSTDAPADRKDYSDATWNGYVTVTDDLFAEAAAFKSARFGSRSDPLVRGECGPRRCHVQFDFIDVVFDSDGSAWAAFVDGCDRSRCVASEVFGEGVVGALLSP